MYYIYGEDNEIGICCDNYEFNFDVCGMFWVGI